MRVIADFASLQTAWLVASRELFASSSGSVLLVVFSDHAQGHVPLWQNIRLWKKSAIDTGEYNPQHDAQFDQRSFMSPWFGAKSQTLYKAYVGISVNVEGDVHPPDLYGFGYGSIGGTLSSVRIQQCLLP